MTAASPQPDEGPITERTKAAILEMHSQLQNVSAEVREIRRMLNRNESWKNNVWRALTNFVGFVKADQEQEKKVYTAQNPDRSTHPRS